MYIGERREPLWDYTVVDKEKTTATLSVNHPVMHEVVYLADAPWEGNKCAYPTVVKDGDIYSLYYGTGTGYHFNKERGKLDESDFKVCKLESRDGIRWTRPIIGKYGENNIVESHPTEPRASLAVFLDDNPDCPPERRYKGIERVEDGCKVFTQGGALACFASGDGRIFERVEDVLREPGKFDSLNTAYYDKEEGVYKLFHRDFLDGLRAVRYRKSKDFIHWDDVGFISFDDGDIFQLYTNNIKQYYRAPHVYIGLPVRYVERKEWTDNYEQLPEREYRRSIMYNEDYKRLGLAMTDTLFMTSRDGLVWHKFNEAFLDSGLEGRVQEGWFYGAIYLSHGFIEAGDELYFYSFERGNEITDTAQLRRYSIRLDGFASFKGDYSGKAVVTKPVVFEGDTLGINFRTSAAGSIYVTVTDSDGNSARSIEIFGNNVDRRVSFDRDLADFSGKEVTLRFDIRDGEIYSFKFSGRES